LPGVAAATHEKTPQHVRATPTANAAQLLT
jgi:hypothetical protein